MGTARTVKQCVWPTHWINKVAVVVVVVAAWVIRRGGVAGEVLKRAHTIVVGFSNCLFISQTI